MQHNSGKLHIIVDKSVRADPPIRANSDFPSSTIQLATKLWHNLAEMSQSQVHREASLGAEALIQMKPIFNTLSVPFSKPSTLRFVPERSRPASYPVQRLIERLSTTIFIDAPSKFKTPSLKQDTRLREGMEAIVRENSWLALAVWDRVEHNHGRLSIALGSQPQFYALAMCNGNQFIGPFPECFDALRDVSAYEQILRKSNAIFGTYIISNAQPVIHDTLPYSSEWVEEQSELVFSRHVAALRAREEIDQDMIPESDKTMEAMNDHVAGFCKVSANRRKARKAARSAGERKPIALSGETKSNNPEGGCFTRALHAAGLDCPFYGTATLEDVREVSGILDAPIVLLNSETGVRHIIASASLGDPIDPLGDLTDAENYKCPTRIILVICDKQFEHAYCAYDVASPERELSMVLLDAVSRHDIVYGMTSQQVRELAFFATYTRAQVVTTKQDLHRTNAVEPWHPQVIQLARVKRADLIQKAKDLGLDIDEKTVTIRNLQNLFAARRKGKTDALIKYRGDEKSPYSAMTSKRKPRLHQAANFSATAAAPPHDVPTLFALMEGKPIPGATPHDAVNLMLDIVENKAQCPKRVGNDSVVMEVTCNGIVPLTDLVPGNVITVCTPMLAAFKGALVFQSPPSGTTGMSVLGYIAPDRDVEEFSSTAYCLGAQLSVSAPLVVGGTSTIVAQMTDESAVTTVSPLSALPGKLATIAVGKQAHMEIMGAAKQTVFDFTYDQPVSVVARRSTMNLQNPNLVRIVDVEDQQPTGCLLGTGTSNLVFSAGPPRDPIAASASGYNPGFGETGGFTVSGSTAVLWNLAQSTDYLRHIFYGNFNLHFQCVCDYSSIQSATLILRVTYSDGSTFEYTSIERGEDDTVMHMFFTSRGNTEAEAKSGLFIASMQLLCTAANITFVSPCLRIEFEEVSADTEYLTHVISGAVPQAKLNIELKVDTEVEPDQTTEAGKFITPDDDLPAGRDFIDLVRVAKHMSVMRVTGTDYRASSFWNGLKKFGKFIWNNGGEGLAKGLLQKGANMIRGKFMSAPFGTGASLGDQLGIAFPGTRGNRVRYFPVTTNANGQANSAITLAVTDIPLTASGPWQGESSDLAFFVASLAVSGWKTIAKPNYPLLLSGDVEDVQFYGTSVSFTLLPIQNADLKFAESPYPNNVGVTPEGFLVNGTITQDFPGRLIFGPSVEVLVKTGTVTREPSGGEETVELPFWRIDLLQR